MDRAGRRGAQPPGIQAPGAERERILPGSVGSHIWTDAAQTHDAAGEHR